MNRGIRPWHIANRTVRGVVSMVEDMTEEQFAVMRGDAGT